MFIEEVIITELVNKYFAFVKKQKVHYRDYTRVYKILPRANAAHSTPLYAFSLAVP
jgi:hypothetical protein